MRPYRRVTSAPGNEMTLIACTCPYCGGEVKMEDTLLKGYCTYCGRQIINEKAVVGKIDVKMDRSSETVNTLKLIKYSMYDGDAYTARALLAKAMQMDPNNSDVWYMDAVLDRKNANTDLARAKQFPSYGIFTEQDVKTYRNFDNSGSQAVFIVTIAMWFFILVACIPIAIIFRMFFLIPIVMIVGFVIVLGSFMYKGKHSHNIPEPVFEDETDAAKQAAYNETVEQKAD